MSGRMRRAERAIGVSTRHDVRQQGGCVLANDLDGTIEAFRDALRVYVQGDAEPVAGFFSTRDDVTLANPLGSPRRGVADVSSGIFEGAENFNNGGVAQMVEVSSSFEEVSRYSTPELGYLVQIERHQGRLASGDDVAIALRVTMIFRPEQGARKIVHRHADPVTSPRPISTTFQP